MEVLTEEERKRAARFAHEAMNASSNKVREKKLDELWTVIGYVGNQRPFNTHCRLIQKKMTRMPKGRSLIWDDSKQVAMEAWAAEYRGEA